MWDLSGQNVFEISLIVIEYSIQHFIFFRFEKINPTYLLR